MNRYLYVTDLDGTLLNSDSRLSDTTVKLLNHAISDGALVSIATARTPATVEPLLRKVHFRLPMVVMTGAALWHPDTQCYSHPRFMPVSSAVKILEVCDHFGLNPFTYTLDTDTQLLHSYHSGKMDRREMEFALERNHLPLKKMHLDLPVDAPRTGDVLFFFGMGERERIMECADALRSATDASVSAYPDIFNRNYAFIEIFANGVSKASAIRNLVEITGATYTTVFGDNLNDLAMMDIADCAVAVDNAFSLVKEKADRVIGSNTFDSVAHYIYDATINEQASE